MGGYRYTDIYDRINDFLYELDIAQYEEKDVQTIRLNEYIHSLLTRALIYLEKAKIYKGE